MPRDATTRGTVMIRILAAATAALALTAVVGCSNTTPPVSELLPSPAVPAAAGDYPVRAAPRSFDVTLG